MYIMMQPACNKTSTLIQIIIVIVTVKYTNEVRKIQVQWKGPWEMKIYSYGMSEIAMSKYAARGWATQVVITMQCLFPLFRSSTTVCIVLISKISDE